MVNAFRHSSASSRDPCMEDGWSLLNCSRCFISNTPCCWSWKETSNRSITTLCFIIHGLCHHSHSKWRVNSIVLDTFITFAWLILRWRYHNLVFMERITWYLRCWLHLARAEFQWGTWLSFEATSTDLPTAPPSPCMRVVSIAISFTRSVRSYTTMSASPPSSRIQPKWHKPKDISNERPVLKLYNSLTKSKVTFFLQWQGRHDDRLTTSSNVDWIRTQATWTHWLVQLWSYRIWRCSYGSC